MNPLLPFAISDFPDGSIEYLGDIKSKGGMPVLKYLTSDPAVMNVGGKNF